MPEDQLARWPRLPQAGAVAPTLLLSEPRARPGGLSGRLHGWRS